jgi:hypothetical protein
MIKRGDTAIISKGQVRPLEKTFHLSVLLFLQLISLKDASGQGSKPFDKGHGPDCEKGGGEKAVCLRE